MKNQLLLEFDENLHFKQKKLILEKSNMSKEILQNPYLYSKIDFNNYFPFELTCDGLLKLKPDHRPHDFNGPMVVKID